MSASNRSWKWYRMPMTVFMIGILSLVMLLALHLIFKYQRFNSTIIDAIMEMETNAAIYHLRIEESIGGVPLADLKGGVAAVDRAIALADGLLNGGADYGRISSAGPLKPRESQARMAEIRSLLLEFREMGLARVRHHKESGTGSIGERQFDAVFNQILGKAAFLEQTYKRNRVENRERMRVLFLGIYLVWTIIIVTATAGIWKVAMRRKAAEESLLLANRQLRSQAEELTAHRENLAGLVKQRTAELTAANDRLRVEIAERRQAEENLKESEQQIRFCSSRLLGAQEIERRRISSELHDGLGQALNVAKLRIRLIEKGLGEDRQVAREECESVLEYLDGVIDDVRRLSLDLSPAILEDLGLTSALRWLVSNFRKSHAMEVTSEIAEIDGLFHESDRITIYRVVQEALANAGKHSRAGRVSVIVRRHEEKAFFSVEDDGRGFDPMAKRAASEKGLGLSTMDERVRMLGGALELWSRAGEGTRVTFTIPCGNRGA